VALFPVVRFVLGLAVLVFGCAAADSHRPPAPRVIDDVSRLNATTVYDVMQPRSVEDFVAALALARREDLKVSIAGRRHSQGGHALAPGALVLDTTRFNQILGLDEPRKVLRVQSGATWRQVQDYANPRGLAVKVMQSSNIFTVGGSLSVNAHGRDPNFGPIIETVESFRLLLPDGRVVNVSRDENAELFSLAIGGFGLFGIILDVDLSLTDDATYEKRTTRLESVAYPDFFTRHVRGRRDIGLHYARLSIARKTFLREMYATVYTAITVPPDEAAHRSRLAESEPVAIPQFFLGLARATGWGKSLQWYLAKNVIDPSGAVERISRNNAMRPAVEFLAYDSPTDTDILQEYFVPVARFDAFVDSMRQILERRRVNLLNVTVRYQPANSEAFLSYSRQESFALVLYINQGLTPDGIREARDWTRELVDLCLSLNGTFYLTYQRYPTPQQVRRAYPMLDEFVGEKRKWDPAERFTNRFYETYRNPE
jgi:FAD/FMN-containing dehydrogenase